MNTAVTVVANSKTGAVITPSSSNPEFGTIRLQQTRISFEGGFMKPTTVSAFIRGVIDHLKMLNLKAGDTLPGKIVIKESTVPTNPKNLDQDVKIAGDSGVPCLYGGALIYRTALYTEDVNATDELLAHDNGDQIRVAMAQRKAEVSNADIEDVELVEAEAELDGASA
jgi:hypothetical protein